MNTRAAFLGFVMCSTISVWAASSHEVKAGENMFRISLRYGITLQQLQAANPGVHPQSLRVGQKLTIPAGGKARATQQEPSAPAQRSTSITASSAPKGSGQAYTVQAGDSLSKIAQQHGTTIAALQAANPSLQPNQVAVGQKILLPTSADTKPTPAQATKASSTQTLTAPAEVSQNPSATTAEPKSPAVSTSTPPPAMPKDEQVVPAPTNNTRVPLATVNGSSANTSPVAGAGGAPLTYRLIKMTRELTLEQVAKENQTTTEKINSLNGWNFSPTTLLAVDSELYIPTQP